MWAKIVIGIVISGIAVLAILSGRASHNWKSGKYKPPDDEEGMGQKSSVRSVKDA